jgi:hypothetical protein
MHQCLSRKQRNETRKCQPILFEQLLRSDVPSAYSKDYNNRRKTSAPPAYQQRRLICLKRSSGRRRGIERHFSGPRPPTSAEGTSGGFGRFRKAIVWVGRYLRLIGFLLDLLERSLSEVWRMGRGMSGVEKAFDRSVAQIVSMTFWKDFEGRL